MESVIKHHYPSPNSNPITIWRIAYCYSIFIETIFEGVVTIFWHFKTFQQHASEHHIIICLFSFFRLFEMGFQEQLNEIIHKLPETRQTLLFSATLPKLLVEFAKAGLHDPTLIRLDVETKISENLKVSLSIYSNYIIILWPWSCGSWFKPRSWRGELDTTLCDKVCQWFVVIKFVSDLWQVGGFLWVLQFSPPIKLTTTI